MTKGGSDRAYEQWENIYFHLNINEYIYYGSSFSRSISSSTILPCIPTQVDHLLVRQIPSYDRKLSAKRLCTRTPTRPITTHPQILDIRPLQLPSPLRIHPGRRRRRPRHESTRQATTVKRSNVERRQRRAPRPRRPRRAHSQKRAGPRQS